MSTGTLNALAVAASALAFAASAEAGWDPAGYREIDTLEFLTDDDADGEHWSTVWLVVIDDAVYVRLGSRAASRMETSTLAPKTSVRIGGEEFTDVMAEPAPDMAEAVAAAMKEKYWTDVFVRWIDHPLTLRLRPQAAAD